MKSLIAWTFLTAFLSLTFLTVALPATDEIDIRGNTVGINPASTCAAFSSAGGKVSILCASSTGTFETSFHDVGIQPVYATGTPVWLRYPNYIGQWNPKHRQESIIGGQTRLGGSRAIVFCDGPCPSSSKPNIAYNTLQ